MDPNTFPTKGNLILAKNSLALSKQGFDLMDKKRNILIKELMELVDQAKDILSHFVRLIRHFREQIWILESAMYRKFQELFRWKIRFRLRPEVLWEQRFH